MVVLSQREQAELREELTQFSRYWLGPARVAPPTISFEPESKEIATLRAVVTPFRAEDAGWNQWPGPDYRLFNNRVGYFFDVQAIDGGSKPLAWIPQKTTLKLFGADSEMIAASNPDDLLAPLLRAAFEESHVTTDGDLVERTRAARGFRTAYLPTGPTEALEGVIGFPLAHPGDADRHVIGMELTLAVRTETGVHQLVWTYD
jgi:hypothetical protein